MVLGFWNIEIPKRAFRFYQRGDIAKTVEALDKSIAKDTLNPAGYYLYSLLYTDTAFARYDVDTAYLYVSRAIRQLPLVTDPKDIEDLNELSVDTLNLEKQKDRIDSLKFIDIKALHTIEGYNWFMAAHDDARQIPEALALRNRIAFEQAEAINTWQRYQQFMQEYPEAEDHAEAEKRYKQLIYEERTADGSYESLTGFLEDFPNTPYRKPIEDGIFKYATAGNTLESFVKFLTDYPNQKLARVLYDRAYHIYKEQYPATGFFKDFDFGVNPDSLLSASTIEGSAWLPKLENDKIIFIDLDGEVRLRTGLESVTNDCLCEPDTKDFVYGKSGKQHVILGRNGKIIYQGIFDEAINGGYGFIILRNVEGDRLIHKSGEVIIDLPVEEIKVLDNRFIRTKENGYYGLTSIHGLPYLANEFVAIDTFKTYLWLEKEEGIQLVEPESLLPVLTGEKFRFKAQYTELEELPNGRIWALKDDQQGIFDQQFNPVIAFGQYDIYERPYGWKLETDQGIQLVHDRYIEDLQDLVLDKVLENDQWLGVRKDSTWALLDQVGNVPMQTGLDSLALWGENMAMIFRNDSVWAQFKTGKQILMEDKWEPKLLIPQRYISSGEKALHDFFMLSNAKKFRKIYNDRGREILAATYNDVVALGPNMLKLQKRNAALADSTGHFLLNFIYDGIGSNNQGYVSILDKGKVGVINPSLGIRIPPTHERLLEPYSDTVLIASDGRYKAFINTKNKELTAFDFDEVRFYTDSIALTRIENEWLLYDIANDEPLYESMLEFQDLDLNLYQKTLLVTKESGKGIYSLERGELIEPTYTDIKVLGTPEKPVFFAMKLVAEADIYVVIYFDGKGNKLFTQSFRKDAYFNIACPSN